MTGSNPSAEEGFSAEPFLLSGFLTITSSFLEDLEHGTPTEFKTDKYTFFVYKDQILLTVLVSQNLGAIDSKSVMSALEKIHAEFALTYMSKFKPGQIISINHYEQKYFEKRAKELLKQALYQNGDKAVKRIKESLW